MDEFQIDLEKQMKKVHRARRAVLKSQKDLDELFDKLKKESDHIG